MIISTAPVRLRVGLFQGCSDDAFREEFGVVRRQCSVPLESDGSDEYHAGSRIPADDRLEPAALLE